MEKIDKTDLGYLGSDFQYEGVKALIEYPQLFKDKYKAIDQNAFTEPTLRKIVGTMKDMYKSNKTVPGYKEILRRLKMKETDAEEVEYMEEAINKIQELPSYGIEDVKRDLTNFFNWKYELLLINKLYEKAKDGYSDKDVKSLIKNAEEVLFKGPDKIDELSFTEDEYVKMFSSTDTDVIPTGIKEVDKNLAGGLGKREIGLFTALTGYGKTTFGTILAHNSALFGFKTLQIFFEDDKYDIMRKHTAIVAGTSISKLGGFNIDTSEKLAAKAVANKDSILLSENLKVVKFPDKQITVEDIEDYIIKIINEQDFRPEMIVIDYFSCLKFSNNPTKTSWEAQPDCMRKLRDLANDYNMAIWVLQQNNRPSSETVAGMGNWQGAYEATQPASVWIELKRTNEQKMNGRADLIFNKTRKSQPKNNLENIVFDNGRMIIDCSETEQDDVDLMYRE